MSSNNTKFSSEGFDLDALSAAIPSSTECISNVSSKDQVVYELGGKISFLENNVNGSSETVRSATATNEQLETNNNIDTNSNNPLEIAESYKKQGNDAFMKHQWQESYNLYTQAIRAVPYDNDNSLVYTGEYLLQLKKEWEKEQYKIARQKLEERDERERLKKLQQQQQEGAKMKYAKSNDNISKTNTNYTTDYDNNEYLEDNPNVNKEDPASTVVDFQPPPHPFGEALAVYYCNRAAASLQLDQMNPTTVTTNTHRINHDDDDESNVPSNLSLLESSVNDCTVAIYFKPNYYKALVRRATAYERMDHIDKALVDIRKALTNMQQMNDTKSQYYKTIVQTERRLQKLEEERMEKLKTETIGKLKELGNSILGNFGLSLDNFQAKQDPNTGSYSISFNNSK